MSKKKRVGRPPQGLEAKTVSFRLRMTPGDHARLLMRSEGLRRKGYRHASATAVLERALDLYLEAIPDDEF